MSDISPSRLGEKAGPAFEKLVSECNTADEIKALYAEKAVRDGLVTRDFYDPSVLLPTDTAAPTKFAKSITGEGGKKLFFEGDSELDVEQRITAYLREQTRPSETKPELQPETSRDEHGRFTRVDDPVAKAELELKFKRGEITTADYLAESSAVDDYLKSQGVSLDDLKKVANDGYTADWEVATREFLERHPDWQGGEAAVQETGRTLQALHLENSPSLESLESAYADMVRRNAVPENPELNAQREIHERISSANSVEEIRSAASSLFGRR
jgi:hypothetical protein